MGRYLFPYAYGVLLLSSMYIKEGVEFQNRFSRSLKRGSRWLDIDNSRVKDTCSYNK